MKKKRERKCAAARSPTMKDYADMAYVTFLYGNNETEFSKKLHVAFPGAFWRHPERHRFAKPMLPVPKTDFLWQQTGNGDCAT
jgi:hypothetical protein